MIRQTLLLLLLLFVRSVTSFEDSTLPVQWPRGSLSTPKAISALISRVLDQAPTTRLFEISIDANLTVNGKDLFILSPGSQSGSIAINGSSGVAAAMGFNYYLKYVAVGSGREETNE